MALSRVDCTPLGRSRISPFFYTSYFLISIPSADHAQSLLLCLTKGEELTLLTASLSLTKRYYHRLSVASSFSSHCDAVSVTEFAMASFPLLCNICPKQPTFSDISHLLTHVGSKGHLSHYFKAQVRSREEPSIRDRLDTYDRWYERNQLEKLLSQRMILKDTKAANSKRKTVGSRRSMASSVEAPVMKRKRGDTPPIQIKAEDLLDPRLSQGGFPLSSLPVEEHWLPPNDLASRNRAFVPHMAGYTATGKTKQQPSLGTLLHGHYSEMPRRTLEESNNTPREMPVISRPSPTISYPDPSTLVGFSVSPPSKAPTPVQDDQSLRSSIEDESRFLLDEETTSESPKLKGVYWPGMDMFDSASPDAKRKRNQKKDGSILEQMMTTSATVEPTELIFYPGGDLYKMRYISGQVESSPPVKMASPIKIKRQRPTAKRKVLGELSANAPPALRKPRASKSDGRARKSLTEGLKKPSSRVLRPCNHYPAPEYSQTDRPFSALDDNKIEWKLTAGIEDRKTRQRFKIHDDHDTVHFQTTRDNYPTLNGSYPFLPQPRQYADPIYTAMKGLPYLNSGYHPQNPSLPPPITSSINFQNNISLNTIHDSYQDQSNKENFQPLTDSVGRIEDSIGGIDSGQTAQRYFATQEGRSTDFFDSFPSHMDFGPFNRPDSFGGMLNPLTFNFQYPLPQPSTQVYQPILQSTLTPISPPYRMTSEGGPEPEGGDDLGDETIEDDESR